MIIAVVLQIIGCCRDLLFKLAPPFFVVSMFLKKECIVIAIGNGNIVLPRYIDHVYIFLFVNIEIKTMELFIALQS